MTASDGTNRLQPRRSTGELEEDDFRGSEFAGWTKNLQGNNDILSLTRPGKGSSELFMISMSTYYTG